MTDTQTNTHSRPGLFTFFWNPFVRIAGWTAMLIGLGFLLLTGWIGSFTNTHFDGVLDTHTGFPAPLWFFLSEGLVNWLSLATCLWVGGFILAGFGKFRALDLYGTQALARWPFILTAVSTLAPGYASYTAKLSKMSPTSLALPKAEAGEVTTFWLVAFVMIVVTVWFVALAWKSFRISCGVKGWKSVVTFVVGIILAEMISKIVILKGLTIFLR